MNRRDLQRLSDVRRREAACLFKSGHFAGAYYLLGYAVECALKARIARQTRRHDFPDRYVAQKAFTHDLGNLLRTAGLEHQLNEDIAANRALELNWAIVKDWRETSRYAHSITKAEARDLFSACTARGNGVLTWIKARW